VKTGRDACDDVRNGGCVLGGRGDRKGRRRNQKKGGAGGFVKEGLRGAGGFRDPVKKTPRKNRVRGEQEDRQQEKNEARVLH